MPAMKAFIGLFGFGVAFFYKGNSNPLLREWIARIFPGTTF